MAQSSESEAAFNPSILVSCELEVQFVNPPSSIKRESANQLKHIVMLADINRILIIILAFKEIFRSSRGMEPKDLLA